MRQVTRKQALELICTAVEKTLSEHRYPVKINGGYLGSGLVTLNFTDTHVIIGGRAINALERLLGVVVRAAPGQLVLQAGGEARGLYKLTQMQEVRK